VTGVGKVLIQVQLTLAGELDIVWRRPGARDQAGAETLVALRDGLLVSHLDTPTPVIQASATRRFLQQSRVFQPPGAMICQGECVVKILGETLDAQGTLAYRLDIVAQWNRRAAGAEQPDSAGQWGEFFGAALASIGGIMLGELPASSQ
jgi:hypothetical protein